jgi:hypothetical protein
VLAFDRLQRATSVDRLIPASGPQATRYTTFRTSATARHPDMLAAFSLAFFCQMSGRDATLVPYLSKELTQDESSAASMFDTNEHAEAQWQRPSIACGVVDLANSRNTVLAATRSAQ